jgi:hypothetical protein
MNAVLRNVLLVVKNCLVVVVHRFVCWEFVCPDLSQRLGEIFSLLNPC